MIINHNIAALNTYRQLSNVNFAASKSLEKLSSGLRINRAGDDAAGLAISEKMRGQIRGLDQAQRNAQDGISLIQTAEGALNEVHSILQRMRELAVQAANDTNTSVDRGEIQKEINALTSEINRIGNTTEFNTQKLLNGEKMGYAATGASNFTGATATVTISAGQGNGALANGITISFTESSTATVATASWSGATLAITLASTDQYSAASLQALIQSATTNAPAGLDMSLFTVTGGTVDASATTVTVSGNITLTGGITGAGAQLQIGANESQSMTVEIGDMRSVALGISTTIAATTAGFTASTTVTNGTDNITVEYALDVSNATNASAAITKIEAAIEKVSSERSKLGAFQNRLEHTINNLGTSSENLQAAESRIRDVDMAKEMMNFTRNNIIAQAATAMLEGLAA
ncbi:flagellin [Neomoorella mulderi]|uniref:Flagellin n=1 Tax=Moorella mulderi DSM 14980 TaxID=1122241 RepID=A0A151AYP6_9FIRM|nr:flagellin [Moorella mulderi]KYH32690.1 flagellin B [Moorella mulderi DSM 14980]